MNTNESTNTSSYHVAFTQIAIGCSILTVFAGLLVLLGWNAHIQFLTQYPLNAKPIVFNSGLSFVLIGLGVILSINHYSKIAIFCGIAVMSIALPTALQYLFPLDFGIDQLFFQQNDSVVNPYRGRMAFTTALCFILSACTLFALSLQHPKPKTNLLGAGLAFLILCSTALFFCEYLANVEQTYHLGNTAEMSVYTIVMFMFLSMALAALAWAKILITGFKTIYRMFTGESYLRAYWRG